MKNRLKKKDIVLMIIILVVAGSCMLLHRIIGEKSADYITVKVNGKIEGVYSLADEQEILNTAQLMAEDLVRCIQENQ